ncbi:MAG: GNAT family N-acetyltransferase [Planctomycetia bacterium]|nr:GNAT family N-acetyltransferase [Planctomycetia bacterium]
MTPLRLAIPADIPAIEQLIALSARGLCAPDYTTAQIEAALGSAWGCDSELIRDGTYFVAEVAGELVACGGWSWRRTLFGGDALPGRQSELLDPSRDAARIRAFFVHPDWSRRGLARAILARCESEARAHGFRSVELLATLTGQRFYQACGYMEEPAIEYPLTGGEVIRFVPMRRTLD